jgi:hypothetical protein
MSATLGTLSSFRYHNSALISWCSTYTGLHTHGGHGYSSRSLQVPRGFPLQVLNLDSTQNDHLRVYLVQDPRVAQGESTSDLLAEFVEIFVAIQLVIDLVSFWYRKHEH